MAVSRELQLDAVQLDSECHKLFRTQLQQTIPHLSKVLEKLEPEISAFIGLTVYVIPLYTNSSLVGQQLLGIKFSGKNIYYRQVIYGLLIVTVQWLGERWDSLNKLLFGEMPYKAVKYSQYFQTTTKILSLLNSVLFLKYGNYPTIYHRALRLRTEPIDPNQPKSADLSTLTRELIWHSFAETLMFALPLINVHKLRRWIASISTLQQEHTAELTEASFFKNSSCAICNEVPVLRTEAKCRHIFCYYCLAANVAATPDYTCPLCSSPVGDEKL